MDGEFYSHLRVAVAAHQRPRPRHGRHLDHDGVGRGAVGGEGGVGAVGQWGARGGRVHARQGPEGGGQGLA